MQSRLNVLSIQPFYGGSHRAFMDGWIENSRHRWSLISLSDRFWKWRMRHSAVYMADRIVELYDQGERWDAIFASDMLNLAEFRGLVPFEIRAIPTIVYFHENQLAYPTEGNSRDLHFSFTNLTTTVAADRVWFNSEYNRDSMVGLLKTAAKKWPDHAPLKAIDQIVGKSSIQYPGIEIQPLKPNRKPGSPIHLIWAARWEHDKNPSDLLATLVELERSGIEFRISLIGQEFRKKPASIEQLKSRFEARIANWGYMPDRQSYWDALKAADIFVSTANHEFFGLSVSEAASIGLHVLLPNRLSYPEILNVKGYPNRKHEHLYDGTPRHLADMIGRLAKSAENSNMNPCYELSNYFKNTYGWPIRSRQMDDELQSIVETLRN